jgi:pimeloyl-ACP methyl ester carboxylesterase
MGFKKIILAGHSFGAYIASLYTLEHKNMVDRLILLSPVGTSS